MNQKIENVELKDLSQTSPLVTEWNILETLNNEIYLELKPEFVTFLRNQFKKRKITQKDLAKEANTLRSSVNLWLNSIYKIPYPAIIKFLEILDIDKTTLTRNINGIALDSGRVKIINPNVVIKMDSHLARLLGYIYGDGCVSSRSITSFTNLNRDLVKNFLNLVKNIFGEVYCYIYKNNDGTLNVTLPLLIGKSLVKCFKDIKDKKIPVEHLLSNKLLITEFIASLFDGEGHVSVQKRQLEILLSKSHMLEDLKILFDAIDIPTSIIHQKFDKRNGFTYYHINIYRRKNIKKFYDAINLKHKFKTESIEKLLNNYSKKYVDYELREAIFAELSKKSLTSSEIVILLEANLSSICKCLVQLEKLNITKKEKVFRKGINKERYLINMWSLK